MFRPYLSIAHLAAMQRNDPRYIICSKAFHSTVRRKEHTMSHADFFARVNQITAGFRQQTADMEASHLALRAYLESSSEELRSAILACDPFALINALWMVALVNQFVEVETDNGRMSRVSGDLSFTLEYIHAVLSSHSLEQFANRRTGRAADRVLELATELRAAAAAYCTVVSLRAEDGYFGAVDATLVFQAMTSWVGTRGYRYQTAEQAFFEFVLTPHDDALKAAYGMSASDIAAGFQKMITNTYAAPQPELREMLNSTVSAAAADGELSFDVARLSIRTFYAGLAKYDPKQRDLLPVSLTRNIGKEGLPPALLEDLAYVAGSETDFYAKGPHRGTPFRTMPGRIKPLVHVDGKYLACDPYLFRDSVYRALQRGLVQRLPGYRRQWKDRQTDLSETAFTNIFQEQLRDAEVFRSVHYEDPVTGEWCECDLVILIADVVIVIEIKAGVMVMHSPDLNFDRYLQKVQGLIVEAYDQCRRFIDYVASSDEVAIFQVRDNRRVEVRRLRLSGYRHVFPIGLTMEAFTPISSFCKELDGLSPILGKYPFVSMSVDDLQVLTHFLPQSGELMHYLSVRQRVAGIKGAFLYDEVDHLGMYIDKNRFDLFAELYTLGGKRTVVFDKASADINRYFAIVDWKAKPPPRQQFPAMLEKLLASINCHRHPGFLAVDAVLRDMGPSRRTTLDAALQTVVADLGKENYRRIRLPGSAPIMAWVQRAHYVDITSQHLAEGEILALASGVSHCTVLIILVNESGEFEGAYVRTACAPRKDDRTYWMQFAKAVDLLKNISTGIMRSSSSETEVATVS
jgi:hypothetical protein